MEAEQNKQFICPFAAKLATEIIRDVKDPNEIKKVIIHRSWFYRSLEHCRSAATAVRIRAWMYGIKTGCKYLVNDSCAVAWSEDQLVRFCEDVRKAYESIGIPVVIIGKRR